MTEPTPTTTTTATLTKSTSTIGIDLGDRKSHICVLDEAGQILEEGTVATTAAGQRKRFERCEPTRIAIEAGGQSGWVIDLLAELCHDVIVANPRKLRITKTGDREMRRHLVQCAQQMLGPVGKDSDLRRWGLALAERGGESTKK
ncbi:MAG: transposase [Planctomycetota bacterium]